MTDVAKRRQLGRGERVKLGPAGKGDREGFLFVVRQVVLPWNLRELVLACAQSTRQLAHDEDAAVREIQERRDRLESRRTALRGERRRQRRRQRLRRLGRRDRTGLELR